MSTPALHVRVQQLHCKFGWRGSRIPLFVESLAYLEENLQIFEWNRRLHSQTIGALDKQLDAFDR